MKIPRVTEILSAFTKLEYVNPQVLKRAAERGTSVHALCAGIAKGNWIPDSMIGEEFSGYVNSFRKWSEAQVQKFVVIEKRYTDEVLQYTGQLDCVILAHDDKLYLVDFKTGAKAQKTYPLQMAAYEYLLRMHNIKVEGAMLVYLDKDGEFPAITLIHDLREEWYVFMSALDCWKYFNKGRKNGRKTNTTDTTD